MSGGSAKPSDGQTTAPRTGGWRYVLVLALMLLGAFAFHIKREGIFMCPGELYGDGFFLANCTAADYGEFDHGAFWFGVEREATANAARADALFLGNSRLQYGFSAPATAAFFEQANRSFYLLGFAYDESMAFTGPLLKRIEPSARAYVINVDGFFTDQASIPAREMMAPQGGLSVTLIKWAWQAPHRVICPLVPRVCEVAPTTYRRIDNGTWAFAGAAPYYNIPAEVVPLDPAAVETARGHAEQFLAGLPVDRSCVFFVYVWTTRNERANAEALAQATGVQFSSPMIEGLQVFDGSHLDTASAERFSRAVFADIGPNLQQCLESENP